MFHCHAGCTQEDVLEALRGLDLWSGGLPPVEDEIPELPDETAPREVYAYRNAAGELVAEKARFEIDGKKTFRWRLPGETQWGSLQGEVSTATLPLYGANLVPRREDEPVYFVEGEKSARVCWKEGLVAVTLAGGANQGSFGKSLEVLRDRDVILWPDNDKVGRTLMLRLSFALETVARSVRWVQPELPEKGDAADYFAAGNTVMDLEGELERSRNEPWFKETALGFTIHIPTVEGTYNFTFEDLSGSGEKLSARVSVGIPGKRTFTRRLVLHSSSGQQTFRREIFEVLDIDKADRQNITRLVDQAVGMAIRLHNERNEVVLLADVPVEDDLSIKYVVPPFVVEDGASIIFGQGGGTKTYFALYLGLCVALGLPFFGAEVQQRNVLFLDYEASKQRLAARMKLLLGGLDLGEERPPFHYWSAEGRSLQDLVPALRRVIKDYQIGVIIVDSAALACGGDASEQTVATDYFNAVARLGVPVLTIAHITKDEEGDKYPFGSVFWHNSARTTWNVKSVDEGDAIFTGLFNRKVNDAKRQEALGFRFDFYEKSVELTTTPDVHPEIAEQRLRKVSLSQRILSLLEKGPYHAMFVAEVMGMLDIEARKALTKMQESGLVVGVDRPGGTLWYLAGREPKHPEEEGVEEE